MVNHKGQTKRKELLDISSKKELTIALLIGGGIVTIAAISPALLAAAIPSALLIKEDDKKRKRKVQKVLSAMEKERLVKISRRKEKAEIILTNKGKKKGVKYYVNRTAERLEQDKRKKWDGKWRVVIFDIPARQRVVRDALRHLIKKMGMEQLQKSVWVYPHDCKQEIMNLKHFFEIPDECLRFIVTDSIGEDKKLRKKFKIR